MNRSSGHTPGAEWAPNFYRAGRAIATALHAKVMSKWHYQVRWVNANICLSLDESAVKQGISSFVGHLIFDESGESVNEGRFYCSHWGTGDIVSDCRISTSVVVGINE